MGFYAAQWWRANRPRGLETAQICIMWEACWSCLDNTAWLAASRGWFMDKCNLSERSLKRHLPQLAKLDLLVQGQDGFRLLRFYAERGQFGAELGANLAQKKERTKERKEFCLSVGNTPPLPPSQARGAKLTRAQRRRIEMLGIERQELQEFFVARCEVCLVPHEWTVRESYFDTSVLKLACPDWKEKLRAAHSAQRENR